MPSFCRNLEANLIFSDITRKYHFIIVFSIRIQLPLSIKGCMLNSIKIPSFLRWDHVNDSPWVARWRNSCFCRVFETGCCSCSKSARFLCLKNSISSLAFLLKIVNYASAEKSGREFTIKLKPNVNNKAKR